MGKINKIELIRWLAIVPVVFISSALSFVLSIFSFEELISIKMYENGPLVIGVTTCVTVCIWLLLTYLIAPKHKLNLTWLSYILGSLFIILISAFVIGESRTQNEEVIALLVSGLSTGLIFCLALQFKNLGNMNSILDKIEEHITSVKN